VTPDCASMLLELKNEINQLKTIIQPPSNTMTTTVDYAAELESLKRDLQSLRNFITTAVEQLKTEIVSIHAIPAPNKMETDVEHNRTTLQIFSNLLLNLNKILLPLSTKQEFCSKKKQMHLAHSK